ncbi:4Fe-4S dicluster domain-containing protein [Adlercreutzia shanghongiae]|uniref:4Fe-4S dicluster domain-containing protein n=1 Tax=Adlercreutzia shanghongiae TaxID=3111773 RepID=A0ABU6IYF0_9ACTN|nr:4Fe-4S dicluster domain-containing protein [Adlercreutzia sp. R22]MEC4294887.1 4Fe-4S dicluster domain-containing protein [Adlercreutzia sp. R22]
MKTFAGGQFAPPEAEGVCVYRNHCQPCPEGIAIGLANKYYDLARLGGAMAADHYRTLERHASDCIHCGHCNRRCPFGVNQSAHMSEIATCFGE